MKFFRGDAMWTNKIITLIPTISIVFDNPIFMHQSVDVQFSFLGFHAHAVWLRIED